MSNRSQFTSSFEKDSHFNLIDTKMPVRTRSEQRRKRNEIRDDWHFHGTSFGNLLL